jgi:hypothetical protein
MLWKLKLEKKRSHGIYGELGWVFFYGFLVFIAGYIYDCREVN